MTDAMFCLHANEVPAQCPCDEDCYCKKHTCKRRRVRMTKKGKTEATEVEKKERAAVGRERRLALVLRAVLDEWDEGRESESSVAAVTVLSDLGYGSLQSIPTLVLRLEAELAQAVESKNYTRVSELGKELEKAREGKAVRVKVVGE